MVFRYRPCAFADRRTMVTTSLQVGIETALLARVILMWTNKKPIPQ